MSRAVQTIPIVLGAEAVKSALEAAERGETSMSASASRPQSEAAPGVVMNGESRRDARGVPGNRGARIPSILPHEKVFPIQIGTEIFKLSGASISSDAPSYFSAFFQCQLDQSAQRRIDGEENPSIRTLYIDRDPVTFADISRHLQGYHITPRDGSHFVKLFADAQFYQLPRLIDQLYEDAIYISIGGREFRISKDIFSSPGDSPNYFTLGYGFLFSNHAEVFPGLKRDGLLRPPSIMPPAIPNHSADIFADLMHILKGYPLHIRNEEHRKELLQDCKYFLFKGVEQKLIPHHISYNTVRKRDEIVIRLEDIRQTGLSCLADPDGHLLGRLAGWVHYARPYVDDKSYELIVEVGRECTSINVQTMRAEFSGDGKTRISRLFEVIANKLNLPTTQPLGLLMANGGAGSQPASPGNTPLSDDQVKIMFDSGTSITLNGKTYQRAATAGQEQDVAVVDELYRSPSVGSQGPPPQKRKRPYSDLTESGTWMVKTGQWRLRVQSAPNGKSGIECIMVAVKLDALSGEPARNERRPFLGA